MTHHTFQSLLQKFFLERLMNQLNASPDTISAYRDTFRLFLRYMKEDKGHAPSQVTIDMVNADNVLGFLQYLAGVSYLSEQLPDQITHSRGTEDSIFNNQA